MKNLLILLVFCLVSLCSTCIVQAENGDFVYISAVEEKVDLGTLLAYDIITNEALTLKVVSNCLHGPVIAAMTTLRNRKGSEIQLNRVFIRSEATNGFVSMERPVVISEPEVGHHDIVIDFKVEANDLKDRGGRYKGTIAFTLLPPV